MRRSKRKKKPRTSLQTKQQRQSASVSFMANLLTDNPEGKYVRRENEDHTTTSMGEYVPFSVSWQKEGGDEAGDQAPT